MNEVEELREKLRLSEERSDRLANLQIDTMVGLLVNYTHAVSEFGKITPMSELITKIEDAWERDFEKMGCPEQQIRRERFRNILHQIMCEQSTKLQSALTQVLACCDLLRVRHCTIDNAKKLLREINGENLQ